jgi:hypothetical protein
LHSHVKVVRGKGSVVPRLPFANDYTGPDASSEASRPFSISGVLNISSPAQVAANLANSKLSTGPSTPDGKAASSQNNFKLGLACRTFSVRKHEVQEDFDKYTKDLTADYQPVTTIERILVLKMAQHHWCSQRAFAAQEFCFSFSEELGMSLCTIAELQKDLTLYIRYQGEHDRAFHKCRQELDKIQNARKAEPAKQELAGVRLEITKSKRDHNQFRNEKLRPTVTAAPATVAAPAPVAVSMPVAA